MALYCRHLGASLVTSLGQQALRFCVIWVRRVRADSCVDAVLFGDFAVDSCQMSCCFFFTCSSTGVQAFQLAWPWLNEHISCCTIAAHARYSRVIELPRQLAVILVSNCFLRRSTHAQCIFFCAGLAGAPAPSWTYPPSGILAFCSPTDALDFEIQEVKRTL